MTNRYKETFETWNKIAKTYEDRFMDLDLYQESYDEFLKLLPSQSTTILELGCGPGNITNYLMAKNSSLFVHGIDIAPNMISLAIKNNPNAQFSIMDCRDIDCINERFEGIIGGFCLPYLSHKDSEKMLFDCYNLLQEKGALYLSFVEGNSSDSGYLHNNSGGTDRMYFYYHTMAQIKAQLTQHGFEISKVIHVVYNVPNKIRENHSIVLAIKNS